MGYILLLLLWRFSEITPALSQPGSVQAIHRQSRGKAKAVVGKGDGDGKAKAKAAATSTSTTSSATTTTTTENGRRRRRKCSSERVQTNRQFQQSFASVCMKQNNNEKTHLTCCCSYCWLGQQTIARPFSAHDRGAIVSAVTASTITLAFRANVRKTKRMCTQRGAAAGDQQARALFIQRNIS